ncbi:MAG: hypothetical protein WCH76_07165 [Candidatus Riflemargulisbacteria bacterium]
MMLEDRIKKLGNIPFTKATLSNLLLEYKSPNDKIANLIKSGEIIQLKRGLYILSPKTSTKSNYLEIIANSLYGPSCVSLDYALSYHGLIPERVYKVTSVTTGSKKKYNNNLGGFEYYHVSESSFNIGVVYKQLPDGGSFLIASKEKALCDKIILTKNIRINSLKVLKVFLFDDLRIASNLIQDMDVHIIDQYIDSGYKTQGLILLKNFIEGLV